jgi:hypothetical protein
VGAKRNPDGSMDFSKAATISTEDAVRINQDSERIRNEKLQLWDKDVCYA